MMRCFNSVTVVFFVLLLCMVGSNPDYWPLIETGFSETPAKSSAHAYPAQMIDHDPIIITSDADFAIQGWSGNGTETDPFLIQDLIIASDDMCIEISGTTLHFQVRNCEVHSTSGVAGVGIFFFNLTNGEVSNCRIAGKRCGLEIESVTASAFLNNTITECEHSVEIYGAADCVITQNRLSSSHGIRVDYCQNCTLTNNSVGALSLWYSTDCSIVQNAITRDGIRVGGLYLSHWMHNISQTTVMGRPYGYFLNDVGSEIGGLQYSQIVLANCSNVVINGGEFRNLGTGIQIVYSDSCRVSNVTARFNTVDGVAISGSTNCTIEDSTCQENEEAGIYLGWSSRAHFVSNSVHHNTHRGISISHSTGSTLSNNLIHDNQEYGVYVERSDNCIFEQNTIERNGVGLHLFESNSSLVIHNSFHENRDGIIFSSASSNNSVYLNTFSMNSGRNAIDNGYNNHWDDGHASGNIWDDYDGTGIYEIPGAAESVDRFPRQMIIMTPITIAVIGLVTCAIVAGLYVLFKKKRQSPTTLRTD